MIYIKTSKYLKNKKIKELSKLLSGIVIGTLVTIMSTYYASTIYYESDEVGYYNTQSNLVSDNVQDAIDELCELADATVLDKIYPIGSVFMSTMPQVAWQTIVHRPLFARRQGVW